MLPILVLMIDSDRFVTNFGPKNHATWPFLSMPWAVIRGWAIIQVWAINREFTVCKIIQECSIAKLLTTSICIQKANNKYQNQ